MPRLSGQHRVIAPDMLGFGYTEAGAVRFDLDRWVASASIYSTQSLTRWPSSAIPTAEPWGCGWRWLTRTGLAGWC